MSSEAQEPVQAPGESVVRRGGRDPGRPGEKARPMARPVRSGDCVSRLMCRSFGRRIPEYVYVEPTRPGGRRDPRPKRATARTRPLSHYVTIRYYPADTGRGRSAGPGPRSYARAAATRATAARSRRRALEAGSGRPRGRQAVSAYGTLARASRNRGVAQLAIAPELLALLLALYATNRYEHIICCSSYVRLCYWQ